MTILVKSLTKKFGSHLAIDGISFSVSPGSIFGLLGPNGSGKTTTLRILAGLAYPNEGEVTIDGQSPDKILDTLGVLFEYPNLYPYLTGYDNVRLLLPKNINENLIESATKHMEINHVLYKKVKNYSLGMRQRLIISAMLVKQPHVWILDEPTTGLDAEGIHLLNCILREQAEQGHTVILTSHALEGLEKVITEFGIIQKGVLLYSGTIKSLMHISKRKLVLFYPEHLIEIAEKEIASLGVRSECDPSEARLTINELEIPEDDLLKILSSRGILPKEYRFENPSFVDFYRQQVMGGR